MLGTRTPPDVGSRLDTSRLPRLAHIVTRVQAFDYHLGVARSCWELRSPRYGTIRVQADDQGLLVPRQREHLLYGPM